MLKFLSPSVLFNSSGRSFFMKQNFFSRKEIVEFFNEQGWARGKFHGKF